MKPKARDTYLGSHDIAAIAGKHPFYSPVRCYMNKLKIGRREPPNEAMEWGSRLEAEIVAKYAELHKYSVLAPEGPTMSPALPYLGATPDGIAEDLPVVLEVKNIRFKGDEWGDEGTDEVPAYILLQAHTHLHCTGLERCDIAVLFSGQVYKEFTVLRDPEIDELILSLAKTFWEEHILAKKPPSLDHTDASRELVESRFPEPVTPVRGANFHEEQIMRSLRQFQEQKKEIEKTIGTLRHELCDLIGDAEGIKSSSEGKASWFMKKGSVSHKTVGETLAEILYGTDWKASPKYLELLNSTRGRASRQFRFTPGKGF